LSLGAGYRIIKLSRRGAVRNLSQ